MMVDWADGTPLSRFTHVFSTPEKFQILDNLSDIISDLVFYLLNGAKDICYSGSIPGERMISTFVYRHAEHWECSRGLGLGYSD